MVDGQAAILISDVSQIGEARRQASRLARGIGLDESTCSNAAIIATELATNLARHAQAGEVFLRAIDGPAGGIEILSVDRGPGMANIGRCLEDGFSTHGTAGNGLGAVQRLSTVFDVGSSQPAGTVVVSQLSTAKREGGDTLPMWAALCRPAPHEPVCGDAWRIAEQPGLVVLMMVDGLGHGPDAAKAAQLAVEAFDTDPFLSPVDVVQRIDRAMRGSRGGAIALARVELSEKVVRYVGVGNIAGRLISCGGEPSRGLVSHNGTAGVQARTIREFCYPLPSNGLLIMHSDGLQSRWTLDQYAGWQRHHPAVVAGMLYRDYTRGRDDVTVAAVRIVTDA